jgi:hypothetical protein
VANASESISKVSRIRKQELENINYEIDIERVLKVDSLYSQQADGGSSNNVVPNLDNRIRVKSVYGQMYECELPDAREVLEDLSEYEEEEAELAASMAPSISNFGQSIFFETSSQSKNSKQYNFTLINEKVTAQMEAFKAAKKCSYRVLT